MIHQHPAGTRRLALVLALSVLPVIAFAEPALKIEMPPGATTHPWKLAYARRIANEGLESREAREEFAKRALREWKKKQRARGVGQHARPAKPEASATRDIDPGQLQRLPRRLAPPRSHRPPTAS
jgi:hypothetical protein